MSIYLFGASALEFWRHARRENTLPKISAGGLKNCQTTRITKNQLAALADYGVRERPVHIVVPDSEHAAESLATQYHERSTRQPPRSFVRAGTDICVPTVECLFLQLAKECSIPALVRVGYELCGGYSLFNEYDMPASSEYAQQANSYCERPQLSDIAKLSAYLRNASGCAGVKSARRALQHIIEESMSPMETEIAMRLSLATEWGGYGLPQPVLNKEVALSTDARRVYRHHLCRPDLLWPEAKLCVEYNGEKEHATLERIASDAARDTALAIMGYEVVTVTRKQRNNPAAFEEIARYVGKRLGKRLRIRVAGFEDRRVELCGMFYTATRGERGAQ